MRISDWSSDVCSSDLTYYETHRQSCPRHWRRDGNDHSVAVDDLRAGEARRVPEAGPYRSQPRRLAPLGGHCVAGTEDGRCRVKKSHPRSEEHTSELQSLMRRSYAVFSLKKQKTYNTNILI